MIRTIKKIIGSKIVKNGVWLTILQIVNTIVPIITIPYITRILGAEEYGVFSIALNWILYFQVFVEFGFGLNGSRKTALLGEKNKKGLNNLYNNIISSRIILALISFAILNIIALISGFSIKIYICMCFLFLMVIGTTFQLTWLFQGMQDMKFITIVNVVSRIISFSLIFLLVKTSKQLYLYCLLYSITLLVSSCISIIIAHRKYHLKFKFSSIKEIKKEIRDGKYLFASSAMIKIFGGFGTTILGIMSTNHITGVYSAIYKIPYILTLFFTPISQVIYPYISSKMNNDFYKGLSVLKKIAFPIFLVFFIFSIIVIVFRNLIVDIMFGKEFIDYSIIIIPLVIQFLFAIINNFIGIQTLVASGNQKEYTNSLVIGCIAIVVLNILLCKLYDIYGISLAAMISELILTISLYINYKKIIKFNQKK